MKSVFLRDKASSSSIFSRAISKVLPHAQLSARFDPVFEDGLTIRYLKENWRARKNFSPFDPLSVRHVGIFSDPRGGSHLLASQFHYLQNAFCFGEGFSYFPLDGLGFRAFLLRGEFGVNSLQRKSADKLQFLFYNLNSNTWLNKKEWVPTSPVEADRYWMFNFRNPLRVLISMSAAGKDWWQFSEKHAEQVFRGFKERMAFMLRAMEVDDRRVSGVIYESFVQDPGGEFLRLCRHLSIEESLVESRARASDFFCAFMRCGCVPVHVNGHLESPVSGERIEGSGGGFNPISVVDPARAFAPSIAALVPKELLSISRNVLGDDLHQLFLDDRNHQYKGVSVDDLVRMASITKDSISR